MRPAKKITIVTFKQPQKLPESFFSHHICSVDHALNKFFEESLSVAMGSEPTNNLVNAQSVRFCRAVVCSDVASSAERLVVNNAAERLWVSLLTITAEHADLFRDAVTKASSSSARPDSTSGTSGRDVDALINIARLWICWSGAVHFIQHLLSWMEKSNSQQASQAAATQLGYDKPVGDGTIRGTCLAIFSNKLVQQGTRVLSAAVRGFIYSLRAHRFGDADVPFLEMCNLKAVMLHCGCYGEEAVGSILSSAQQQQQQQQKSSNAEAGQPAEEEEEEEEADFLVVSAANSQLLQMLPAYLRETRQFYIREARELLASAGGGGTGALCEVYATRVHQRLNEERHRSQHFLASFSRPHADAVLQRSLVAPPFDSVVERDFAAAIARVQQQDVVGGGGGAGSMVATTSSGMMMARTSSSSMTSSPAGSGLSGGGVTNSGAGSSGMQARASSGMTMSSATATTTSGGLASTEVAVVHRIYVFATLPHVGAERMEKLRAAFKAHVAAEATMLVSNAQGAQQEAQMVPQLIGLYAKCEALVTQCFRGDDDFRLYFRESLQKALRMRQTKVAELVAKQFDILLREGDKSGSSAGAVGGSSAGSSEATLAALERLSRFARLVPAKDIFESFYMMNLSKRLLHFRALGQLSTTGAPAAGTSSSSSGGGGYNEDLEQTVISRLKQICGPTIATRCTGMMKDMELSRDFVSSVADRLREADPEGLLDPLVLTQGYWPTTPEVHIPLPADFERLSTLFGDLYAAEFKRRKLIWSPLLSSAVVKAQFWPRGSSAPSQKKELTVSFLQAVILTQLSGRETPISEDELRKHFSIDASSASGTSATMAAAAASTGSKAQDAIQALNEGLQCALFSLVAAKLVVATERKESVTTITKLFEANRGFSHRQVKIRVAQVQLRAAEESQQTAQSTISQRAHTVDAGIARIMKAKKELKHWELVSQTIELTKLPLDPADIKKRIEVLIDRGFIRRDQDDPSLYQYVA